MFALFITLFSSLLSLRSLAQLRTSENITTHLLLQAQEKQWLSAKSGSWLWFLCSFVANEFKMNRQLPICPPGNMENMINAFNTTLVKSSFKPVLNRFIYTFLTLIGWQITTSLHVLCPHGDVCTGHDYKLTLHVKEVTILSRLEVIIPQPFPGVVVPPKEVLILSELRSWRRVHRSSLARSQNTPTFSKGVKIPNENTGDPDVENFSLLTIALQF